MKKIILTGGGTAGHVTPNIALISGLQEKGCEISYIGSYNGIEKELIAPLHIPYFGISSGKLRRYFSLRNFTDPFRVLKGFFEAFKILRKEKPDLVFSKGGFVSVPVVFSAGLLRIPVIIHESDMTPGLANRLAFPFASKICCNFPETVDLLPKGKAVLSGSPIRKELMLGDREEGKRLCGFTDDKPVVLVTGGSLGAVAVNKAVREALPSLLERFHVVHLCGKGKTDPSLENTEGYAQFEYVQGELKHLFALCDVVISRAGANSICELLALRKPSLLIPLPAHASRGDQILNARSFQKQGFSILLEEEHLNPPALCQGVFALYDHRDTYIQAMNAFSLTDAARIILDLIEDTAKTAR